MHYTFCCSGLYSYSKFSFQVKQISTPLPQVVKQVVKKSDSPAVTPSGYVPYDLIYKYVHNFNIALCEFS